MKNICKTYHSILKEPSRFVSLTTQRKYLLTLVKELMAYKKLRFYEEIFELFMLYLLHPTVINLVWIVFERSLKL